MSMFQDNFISISYKRKFLGKEPEYANTIEDLDDEEGIVAQTKEPIIWKPKLDLTGEIYRKNVATPWLCSWNFILY